MPRSLVFAALGLAALSSSTVPSTAASECAARSDVVMSLEESYGEDPVAVGVVNPNLILEVFVSDGGTWTIVVTDTDGKSCVISAGEGWDSRIKASLPGSS
ncbi:MAG: hypothetical protein ABS58_01090 [Mesorhizobium sp. SCN 65-20]|nr:MAG: hypothetical protein ABS58_01090 [Mesorhizobium sp. SCN 65-20]